MFQAFIPISKRNEYKTYETLIKSKKAHSFIALRQHKTKNKSGSKTFDERKQKKNTLQNGVCWFILGERVIDEDAERWLGNVMWSRVS